MPEARPTPSGGNFGRNRPHGVETESKSEGCLMKRIGHVKINEEFPTSSFSQGLLNMRDGFMWYADEGIDLTVISTKADEGSSGFGGNDKWTSDS